MAKNQIIEDEDEMNNLGFKTALFIDVPNWSKEKNTNKSINDTISAGNTPDQNKLNESNKSLISNLISRDLLKKLEEESPSNFDKSNYENYFENQHFYCRKLSFNEENEDDYDDCEDSDTKVSKISKKSKDSSFSSEKINIRKPNSMHISQNSVNSRNNLGKKYPSSLDNHQKILKSNEETFSNNKKENNNSNSN